MLTLDIQDTSIRAVVFRDKAVKIAAAITVEPGLVKDGLILDPGAVSLLISDLLKTHGINESSVIAGVTGVHSIYRLGKLPSLKGALMEEAVLHEITRSTPVPLDQIYTAWQAIPITKNDATVAIIGLPRPTVDALYQSLKLANLACKQIVVRPLAAAFLIGDQDAVIINVLPDSFNIVIVNDGIPQLLRSLPSMETHTQPSFRINTLKEELDRTISFYNSEHADRRITNTSPVYISGMFRDMLAEKMGFPPNLKQIPSYFSYPEGFNENEFTINLGLALAQAKRGTSPMRVNLNVLPASLQPKKLPLMGIAFFLLLLIMIAITGAQATETIKSVTATAELQSKLDVLQKAVTDTQAKMPEITKLQDQLKKIKAQQDAMNQVRDTLKAQRVKITEGLGQVTSLLPGTVNPGSISYNSLASTWTITGTTTGSNIIINYVSELQSSGKFMSAIITSMQEVEARKWSFTVTAR